MSTPTLAVDYSRSLPTDSAPSPAANAQFDWARAILPLHTPEMRPGVVLRNTTPHPEITRPIFLVGSDPRSLQWLRRHRHRLHALHATGLLVEARTVSDLAAVASAAQGLPITPAPASALARHYGLTRYPLLLSAQGVEP
ncbi:hypothetical protein JCM17961_15720 [Endothiovibrio diazotrophicus]